MPLTIHLTPGKVVTEQDLWTVALLNAIANPTIELEGAIGALTIGANAITLAMIQDGIFTADAAGRAKFAPGFVNTALLADGVLSADSFGWPKMADAYVTYVKLATDAKMKGAPARDGYSSLLVKPHAGSTASKVDVTAGDLIVKDSLTGIPLCLSAVNVTVDIGGTVGTPNALDTGAEVASTWYYIWVISDGTTTAGLLSTSNTAPAIGVPATPLANYTYKALVGAVHNGVLGGSTTDFMQFYQSGRVVTIPEGFVFTNRNGIAALAVLVGGDLSNFQAMVPPIAKVASGNMGLTVPTPTITTGGMTVAADTTGMGAAGFNGANMAVLRNSFYASGNWRVGLQQQNIAWTTGDTNSICYRLTVTGFEI